MKNINLMEIEKNFYNSILEKLKNKEFKKWVKSWISTGKINGFSGYGYNGFNSLMLSDSNERLFFTEKELDLLKSHIRDINKFYIIKQSWITKLTDSNGSFVLTADGKEKKIFCEKLNRVYSLDNIYINDNIKEKIEKYTPKEKEHKQNNKESIEKIIKAIGVKLIHINGNRCFYSPSSHTISMQKLEFFKTAEDYEQTLLHELAHSTKAVEKLKRDENYADEELVAELSAMLFGQYIEIESNEMLQKNIGYLNSWLDTNKKDDIEKRLLKAFVKATKIFEFFIEKSSDKQIIEQGENLIIKYNKERTCISLLGTGTLKIKDDLKIKNFKFGFDKEEKKPKWYTTVQNFEKYFIIK